MTYEVLVEGGFTARHGIRLPDGSVEPSHAHDWRVTVRFVGSQLDDCGMLVDFRDLKSDLDEVTAPFDQADLNRSPVMQGLNPTAEHVAKVIFETMSRRRHGDKRFHSVRVMEAPGCTAVYGRGDRG